MTDRVATGGPLVEREPELDVMRRVSSRVEDGQGRLLMVTGDAGIGKTRLASEFFARLDRSWKTVIVRAGGDSARPLGGLLGAVPAKDTPEIAVGAALAATLRDRATGTKLAVFVDDAHQLDPMVIAALGPTVEALADVSVLLVATFRVGVPSSARNVDDAVAGLHGHPLVNEVRVPPLSSSGISQLAGNLGRSVDDATVSTILRRSGGNAFFVEELLETNDEVLPLTVSEAVMNRFVALPAPAQRVAETLALAESGLPRAVAEAADESGGRGTAILLETGLAVESPTEELMLRHGLVAEVVRRQLSVERRQSIHAVLAACLAEQPNASAANIARHWNASGDVPRAAEWAQKAADEASDSRAYRSASDLYEIALNLPPDDPLDRAMIFDHAAVAAAWSGLTEVALARARAADRAYVDAGQGWRAAAMWLNPALQHVPKPAIDRSELSADAVPALLSDAGRAAQEHRYDRAAELSRRALRLSNDPAMDHFDAIGWQIAAAMSLIGAGHAVEGEELLQRLRAMATADREWAVVSKTLTSLSGTALGRGEIDQAIALDHQALEAGRRAGTGTWLIQIGLSLLYLWRGDLDDAQGFVDELTDADEPVTVEFAQLPAALIDLERGELASAGRRLERMSAVETLGVASFTAGVYLARARWRFLSDDPAGALASLIAAEGVTGDVFEPSRLERLLLKVRCGWSLGDHGVLAAVQGDLRRLESLGGTGAVPAAARWVAGVIGLVDGDHDLALRMLREGAESLEQASRFLAAADVWCDVADAARDAGDTGLHNRAVTRVTEIAAARHLPVVSRRLDARETVPYSPAAFDVLTPREREIATLVAHGLTNKDVGVQLFISEHTVRNQLVKIFAKLGVARRTELAALLAR